MINYFGLGAKIKGSREKRKRKENKERLGCLNQTRPPSRIYAALKRRGHRNKSNSTIKGWAMEVVGRRTHCSNTVALLMLVHVLHVTTTSPFSFNSVSIQ
jgi:hypothetical protein